MKQTVTILLAAMTLTASAAMPSVVPLPHRYDEGKGVFKAKKDGVGVYMAPSTGLDSALTLEWLADAGLKAHFTPSAKKAQVLIEHDAAVGSAEGYTLSITPKTIKIAASTQRGAVYGLQTLRQLGADGVLECSYIADEPAVEWRSYLLDESRHFFGTEVVETMIDELSRLKFNTLHWHLTDGAGWRLEIPSYPNLTEIGAHRDYDCEDAARWDSIHPGVRAYYNADEVRHLVDYASKRGIRIVPEIEIPGHSRAAITSYRWLGSSSPAAGEVVKSDILNVTSPAVDGYLKDVLSYVVDLFEPEYVHIGGDEADYSNWLGNDTIVAYMTANGMTSAHQLHRATVDRYARFLADKGVHTIGWKEITGVEGLPAPADSIVAQFWVGDISGIGEAAGQGYLVVNSAQRYTYLDYDYDTTPLWKPYKFAVKPPQLDASLEDKVIGFGAQMWNEYVPDYTRLGYMTFPRLGALAECGWSLPESRDYASFIERVGPLQEIWRRRGLITDQPVYSPDEPNARIPEGRGTLADEL